MTAGALSGDLSVLVVGALACAAPVANTADVAVRSPRSPRAGGGAGHPAGTARLLLADGGRRRLLHRRRAGAAGHGSWWLPRIILLLELAADFGCFWVARRKIAAVKQADGWFAGLRQTIATDTESGAPTRPASRCAGWYPPWP